MMKRKITALLLCAALLAAVAPAALADGDDMMTIAITSAPLLIAPAPTAAEPEVPAPFEESRPSDVYALSDGGFLVPDSFNKVIWKINADGSVEYFAGSIGVKDITGEPQGSYVDGPVDLARFVSPRGIAPFAGGWAVTDTEKNVIRFIDEKGIYTLAGNGYAAAADGSFKEAGFDRPTGIAADELGGLYVADTGSGSIRRLDGSGEVQTVVSGLCSPTGLCYKDGYLYVAETGRCRILKVWGIFTEVIAGVSEEAEDEGEYYGGYRDGSVKTALFDHPQGVAVADDGTVYVADTGNAAIRAIKNGYVYTVAKNQGEGSTLAEPTALAVCGDSVYVADAFRAGLASFDISEPSYTDVPKDAPYAAAAIEAAKRGIVRGTAPGVFSADLYLDRAQAVTLVSRVELFFDGSVVIDGNSGFDDVPDGAWYAEACRWAADAGIAIGIGDGLFAPRSYVTAEQLLLMLRRWEAYAGLTLADESAEDAFAWGAANKLLSASADKTAPLTRAEAVTVMINFMDAAGM